MLGGKKTAVACGLALVSLVAMGCLSPQPSGEEKDAGPPDALSGVMYSCPGGMTRDDFFIWVSPEAIVETFYYPESPPEGMGWPDLCTKEDVPITAEQWADVEQVVMELYPLMRPEPEPSLWDRLWDGIGRLSGGVLDGVYSSSITCIWKTEAGEQRIAYSKPDDDRIFTLVALLRELADPIGRDIPRYTPPVLCGIRMEQSGTLFSKAYVFHLGRDASAPEGEEAPYTYRATFSRFGQPLVRLRQQKVPAALWEDFAAFAAKIGLEGQTTALWEKPCCTLYYADGSHKRKKLDKETAAQIREYLENLALQLLQE